MNMVVVLTTENGIEERKLTKQKGGGKTALNMKGDLKMKTYTIGNKICFSKQGAIDYFKLFAKRCYSDLSMESSCVLDKVAEDLHRELGLSYREIEDIEMFCIA